MNIRIVDKRGRRAPLWLARFLSDADMTHREDGFWRTLRSLYRIEVSA